MTAELYYFADFVLDPTERQLFFKQQQLELNARYLDALLLLVQDAGKLVSKERFFKEVWQGMVVSDEALTQCIRTLRRLLQDNAAAPLFIETVPKHGYRFIAPVLTSPSEDADSLVDARTQGTAVTTNRSQSLWLLTGQGVMGAAIAGLIGGALYGLGAAAQVVATGNQALAILLVMLSVTTLIAILGGAGVAFGLAAASLWQPRKLGYLLMAGGTSGLLIGTFVSLLLREAFLLFFGRSPIQITGAAEGLLLGLAAGLSCWLLAVRETTGAGGYKDYFYATVPGMLAGLLLSLTGGVLLAGSLAQLVAEFPQAAAGSVLALERFRPSEGVNVLIVLCATLEAGLFTAGLTLGLQRAAAPLIQAE